MVYFFLYSLKASRLNEPHFFLRSGRWIPDSPIRYQGSAVKDRFHNKKEAITSPASRNTNQGSGKFFKSGKSIPDKGKKTGLKK
jgi:hypothetical protein